LVHVEAFAAVARIQDRIAPVVERHVVAAAHHAAPGLTVVAGDQAAALLRIGLARVGEDLVQHAGRHHGGRKLGVRLDAATRHPEPPPAIAGTIVTRSPARTGVSSSSRKRTSSSFTKTLTWRRSPPASSSRRARSSGASRPIASSTLRREPAATDSSERP